MINTIEYQEVLYVKSLSIVLGIIGLVVILCWPNALPGAKQSAGSATEYVLSQSACTMQPTPDSTCFSEVGYDAQAQALYVVFRSSGAKYRYDNVPQSVWDGLISSASLGRYFNSYIKGHYDYTRMQ